MRGSLFPLAPTLHTTLSNWPNWRYPIAESFVGQLIAKPSYLGLLKYSVFHQWGQTPDWEDSWDHPGLNWPYLVTIDTKWTLIRFSVVFLLHCTFLECASMNYEYCSCFYKYLTCSQFCLILSWSFGLVLKVTCLPTLALHCLSSLPFD